MQAEMRPWPQFRAAVTEIRTLLRPVAAYVLSQKAFRDQVSLFWDQVLMRQSNLGLAV
jgi:hypothetical protein